MTRHVILLLTALAALTLWAPGARANTLQDVQERGYLRCGVNTGLEGFAFADANGAWRGLDADLCRAVAAAVLGDPEAVEFVPLTAVLRFQALQSGAVDMLARNTTYTFMRDAGEGIDFPAIYFYDEQAQIVPADSEVTALSQLAGRTICVITGTTGESALSDLAVEAGVTFTVVPVGSLEQARLAYTEGRCIAFSNDLTSVAALRASFENPAGHRILPDRLSRTPLALAVRHGDSQWGDIVRWTFYALVIAEKQGITQANALARRDQSRDPATRRLLGAQEDLGALLGLERVWALNAILSVGNYGEVYRRNVGPGTVLDLERGPNALQRDGGLMTAPPLN